MGNSVIYEYDGFNRLTDVSEGINKAEYKYNSSGLRTSKTVNGEKTDFILDGIYVIAEIKDGDVTNYIRGLCGIIYSKDKKGTKTYYVTNNHGDVTALVNNSGNIVKEYAYDEYGVEANPDKEDTNPFRYCGEYYDTETGFIYLRARYYDPELGRFISEDPARSETNWYVYCSGNPVVFADPSGLDIYYFVSDEFKKEAWKDAKLLEEHSGEPVHVLITDTRDSFIEEWNKVGSWAGKDVDVYLVVINMHGNPEKISPHSDGSTGPITTSDIKSGRLISKNIDRIVLLSCNTGHFDHRYSSFANKMLVYNNVKSVVAADGTVSTRSLRGQYKTRADDTFNDYLWPEGDGKDPYRKNYGFIDYTKNDKGELEWKIREKYIVA